MSFNTFGKIFRFTTWGESHGPAIGCIVDGCPPNIEITIAPINGTYGIFFSTKYIIATANNVEIINGGIALLRLLPLL